jgi:GNAT superfamily N-acetyltransferase
MIRRLDPATDATACDAIVASLPEWFAIEEGIREAAEAARTHEGFVATDEGGRVVGFITTTPRYPTTAEVSWMAVHRDHRRGGHGRALLEATKTSLAERGVRLLLVKTLSDREDPGPEYRQTRAFYLATGFIPVMELDIWGPENPCQVLATPV